MKGQLPLLDRGPFCPARDCFMPCAVAPGLSCSCRPCRCPRCRGRRARARRARGSQELFFVSPQPLRQSRLFTTPTF